MINTEQIECPSCKARCDVSDKFCDSCGLSLSIYSSTNSMLVAGKVSILSSPIGLLIVIAVAKILPKYDFLGFATILLIWLVLLCAGISGLVSGVIALRPTMNSKNNKRLGFIGMLLGILTIGSALFLKKWINYLA